MISGKAKEWGCKRVQIGKGEVNLIAIPENKVALVGMDGLYSQQLN